MLACQGSNSLLQVSILISLMFQREIMRTFMLEGLFLTELMHWSLLMFWGFGMIFNVTFEKRKRLKTFPKVRLLSTSFIY